MRDIFLSILTILGIIVGFYSFQILVLLTVGYTIWLCAPTLRKFNSAVRG